MTETVLLPAKRVRTGKCGGYNCPTPSSPVVHACQSYSKGVHTGGYQYCVCGHTEQTHAYEPQGAAAARVASRAAELEELI